jgi:hypothetical protein
MACPTLPSRPYRPVLIISMQAGQYILLRRRPGSLFVLELCISYHRRPFHLTTSSMSFPGFQMPGAAAAGVDPAKMQEQMMIKYVSPVAKQRRRYLRTNLMRQSTPTFRCHMRWNSVPRKWPFPA